MRAKKTRLIVIIFLTVSLLSMAVCAEITEYEAIDSTDGVTRYYLTLGHEPDAFGNIWYGGPGCVVKNCELDGDLPDGLYLIDDDRGISLAGQADLPGEYAFTLTLRYVLTPDQAEQTTVFEYVCYVLDGPTAETLVFSDGHFHLLTQENSASGSDSTVDTNAEDGFFTNILRFFIRLFSSGNIAK